MCLRPYLSHSAMIRSRSAAAARSVSRSSGEEPAVGEGAALHVPDRGDRDEGDAGSGSCRTPLRAFGSVGSARLVWFSRSWMTISFSRYRSVTGTIGAREPARRGAEAKTRRTHSEWSPASKVQGIARKPPFLGRTPSISRVTSASWPNAVSCTGLNSSSLAVMRRPTAIRPAPWPPLNRPVASWTLRPSPTRSRQNRTSVGPSTFQAKEGLCIQLLGLRPR
mmetsp:Transcript_128719/g.222385  ORF Transcript_128719/g.222385 Transcript_128719/m.222385 type:complete len:222 (+) Transcript_128719:3045-3710(+)